MDRTWDFKTIKHLNDVANRHAPGALRCEWTNIDVILRILHDLAAEQLCHVFFPTGGGLDLTGAKKSHEHRCLELDLQGIAHIVRHESLHLERFEGDETGEWTYFRLNLTELAPSGVYSAVSEPRELLTEIDDGEYAERSIWDEEDRPLEARPVTRWLKGALVIFAKGSLYNHAPGTYDGRHSLGRDGYPEVRAAEFRSAIEHAINYLRSNP